VRMSRRTLFFLALAAICLIMLAPTPSAYRWVNLASAGLALFWALMFAIEDVSSRRSRREGRPGGDMPAGD